MMRPLIERPRLTLRPEATESPQVREAKSLAAETGYPGDPHMTAFALALIEERDLWNGKGR